MGQLVEMAEGADGRLRGVWGVQPIEVAAAGRGEVSALFCFSGLKITGRMVYENRFVGILWMGGQFWRKVEETEGDTRDRRKNSESRPEKQQELEAQPDLSGTWDTGFSKAQVSRKGQDHVAEWGARKVPLSLNSVQLYTFGWGISAAFETFSLTGELLSIRAIRWSNGQTWTKIEN